MEVLCIENVKQREVNLRADLTKCYIFPWHKLGEGLCPIVARDKALIENQLGHGERDWILELRSNRGVVSNGIDRHHSNVKVSERVGIPLNLSLEQIWMVAHFPELHNKIHQILHLLLVFSECEEILG